MGQLEILGNLDSLVHLHQE